MDLLPMIYMVFQVYFITCGWILNIGILLHPVHHLPRVDHTSDKGGGKLKDNIQMNINISNTYIPINQNLHRYNIALQLEWIITIGTYKLILIQKQN